MNAVRDPSVDAALDKWRAHWPEWPLAEPFVPAPQRERAIAWFALRDALLHAAWSGSDPRPGEAKLAWWGEELLGWSKGVRRHPLGAVLQREPAHWASLAAALPSLLASRERAGTIDEAFAVVSPFAEALAGIGASLFGNVTLAPTRNVAAALLAERALLGDAGAVPLEIIARIAGADSDQAALRAWARALRDQWPAPREGTTPGRIQAALLRERLARFARGGAPEAPLPAWRAVLTAWRAARR